MGHAAQVWHFFRSERGRERSEDRPDSRQSSPEVSLESEFQTVSIFQRTSALSEEVHLLGTWRSTRSSSHGTVKHLGQDERSELLVEMMSGEALTTSEIEGEIFNRASVQSSIQKQLGIATATRRATPAEKGIAEMMVDLYRSFSDPLADATLFSWHRMVTSGRHDMRNIGSYRTSGEPMQVVSGRIDAPTVHFEAPPAKQVPSEMKRFILWFNRRPPQHRTVACVDESGSGSFVLRINSSFRRRKWAHRPGSR